ncbi:hypothetical protein J2744_000873 [Halorubrum trapanicum]|uniref:DUF1565 domain-containing protein n=1 Tax=Halorubrum trapanicum TaxID=29284 RepID=A0A8J7R7S8_9EURY|nr:hypothetical protein [Halorubrum trapanicum]MBP1901203.1 hypothetical protein [Halorubrum trapanicum]
MPRRLDRRQLLRRGGVVAAAGIAGCTGSGSTEGSDGETGTDTGSGTTEESSAGSGSGGEEARRENPNTIFVAEDGALSASGTTDDPLSSIQDALSRVEPGDTIRVRPGVYEERVAPPRGGRPGDPITITGPPDAVLKSDPRQYNVVLIRHSHVHITGLTIDGLENPDAPEEADSYSRAQLVQTRPPTDTDEYLTDIVVSPHRIGNTQKSIVSLERTRNVEVGPFRVIGPAGAKYLFADRAGHNGEIVYVGTSPSNLETDWHPWSEYDQSSDVLIHHIDNSEGYGHSELVNTKLGTHDVTVEYCTDGGGSRNTEDSPAASVRFQSFDATLRWCDLRNGLGYGVEIASFKARDAQKDRSEPSEIQRRGGTDNAVYGNRIAGFDDAAIAYPVDSQTERDQRRVCGNEYDGESTGDPGASCSSAVPQGDGLGHTGGDSPWA